MRLFAHIALLFLATLLFGRGARAQSHAPSAQSLTSIAAPATLDPPASREVDGSASRGDDRRISMVGVACAAFATRVVARDLDLDAAAEPSELDGGRSGLRAASVVARAPIEESDQGCIDRVRGEEVERAPVPLSFDHGDFDPAGVNAPLEVLGPFESAVASPSRRLDFSGEAIRLSLERPPRS